MSECSETIRVLHVDDEPDVAELTATYLEREDDRHEVRIATSAMDGLDMLAQSSFDCVVSDFDMPEMTGIELLETVREEYPNLPFILYTGKGSEEVASDAIMAGVTDYLQKGSGSDQYALLSNRIRNAVEQTRANQRATEQQRINQVVREINEALARATTRAEIDTSVCEIISDADPYRFAWIGEHDAETNRIEPRSAAGIDDEYLQTVEITADESPTGQGPTGRAVRTGEMAVTQDIPGDEQYEPWQEPALDRGYRSSAAVPLIYDDTQYGVLNVYANRTHAFDQRERQLLSDVGETIAHAHHRSELQRQYTDQYRTLFEQAPVMVVFTRAVQGGPIIDDCNQMFADRLGYRREELRGTPLADYYTDTSAEILLDEDGYQRALTGEFVREQRTLVTREGEDVLTILRASPRRDQDGEIIGTHALFLDITDEQQVQELRRKERRYQAIFNDPNILVGLIDPDGTVLDINQTAMDYVDVDRADVIGTPFWETPWFDHSADAQDAAKDWIERAASGEYVEFEADLVRPDGDPYIVEGVLRPVTDEDGDVVSVIISDRDITERKERERQFREEQQFTESILRSLPDPLYAFDSDGYLIRWNDQFRSVVGYSDEEISSMHVTEFVPAEEVETIERNVQRVFHERQSVTIESTVETKSGNHVPFELTGSPLEDADGDLRGMTGIGRDITERQSRARRLEALNHATRDLLSAETTAEIAEISVDVAETVIGLDANALYLYDEDSETLEPMAITETGRDLVGDPPTFTGDDSIAWRVYQSGESLAVDDVQRDSDLYNPETPVESELFLPIGSDGILMAGSPRSGAFDQQDLLIGEILASNIATALEQVERVEQLHRREQRLARQNDRLEEFASIVSHDLRTPLNVAQGHLELARAECESEQLAHVAQAHDRMATLIEDILTLSREGGAVSEYDTVDLPSVVDECWPRAGSPDATLVVDVDRSIRADESRLKQVFENLFRNAVEHGGDDVTVRVGDLPNGFFVEDDGPGIPENEESDVFEAGYSTSQDGTGFGLSIVMEVVEAHGWDVRMIDGTQGGARIEITGVDAASS